MTKKKKKNHSSLSLFGTSQRVAPHLLSPLSMPQAEARVDLDIAARAASGAETSTSSDSSSGSPTSSSSSPSLFPPPPSSTFTVSPLGASLAGIAVAAGACALAAGGHWRATASALAEEGIDAVTRRKAVPTAVRKVFFPFPFFLSFFLSLSPLSTSSSHLFFFSTPHQQARALGVATAACAVATALVGGAASALGFLPQLSGETSVATPAAAAEAAERARAAVRGSMRAMILGEEEKK